MIIDKIVNSTYGDVGRVFCLACFLPTKGN